MTKVVNVREVGWDAVDVFIGRPSKWGNPFMIGRDGTREEVIVQYEAYLFLNEELTKQLHELEGKTLGCFCKPLDCHGDVLVSYLENGYG